MARKDFDEYFAKISNQYQQLQLALQDMSEEVNNGVFAPERLEQLKLTILPVKNSYETLSYIKYLLDKPTRKSKFSRYNSQSRKILTSAGDNTAEKTLSKNEAVIKKIRAR